MSHFLHSRQWSPVCLIMYRYYDEKIDFEDLFQRSCSKTYLDWKSATMSLLSEIFEEPSNRMYLCFL